MSDSPFGFTGGPDPDRDPDRPGGADPMAALFGSLGGDPADLGALLHKLGDLLSWRGGPVNWDVARQLAEQTLGPDATADPVITPADEAAVQAALRLAELWLDVATALPAGATSAVAWSRAQWLAATQPVWAELVDPIAAKVVEAMGSAIPAEITASPMAGMLGQIGGVLFGTQVGQALGTLAGEVVASTDIGVPLGPAHTAALLPAGIVAFGAGLGVPDDEVRLYLALREAAHHRLYAHVPWLRGHVLAAIAAFARGIRIDTEALEAAVRDIDPNDPESLSRALGGEGEVGLLNPQPSPDQAVALTRLETILALIEGWVDDVVDAAATGHLPAAAALRETVRRRRAVGGPAEQTFATLVGLELRPRRLREAAALWAAVRDQRGVDGRDAVWAHPDLLPGAEDLDDPQAFLARDGAGEDLHRLLDELPDDPAGS